jgi:alkylation response protein AidB-like acyl-CoA dehydrogenase
VEQVSHILVPARLDDGSIGLFYVEPGSDGVMLTAQKTSDGQPHAQLELAAATVAGNARLGSHGEGAEVLPWLVYRATAARCMMQLGVTERALEMTAEYSRERIQFDRSLGSMMKRGRRSSTSAGSSVSAVSELVSMVSGMNTPSTWKA